MNQWRISEALSSTRRLEELIYQLTGEELARAIELEESALRRLSVLNRLRRDQRRRERNSKLQP
jgi:hypothetical protein